VEFAVDEGSSNVLAKLISQLKAHEQRKYFNQILIYVSNRYFGTVLGDKNLQAETASPVVSGVARILHDIIKGNELLRDHLVTTLTRSSIPALDGSLTARRSVIAALAPDDGK
jgi:telomere length regulation protein